MDASEYIDNRLQGLTKRSDEFLKLDEEVTNEFDTWSALKLILHSSIVDMYTRVHKDRTDDIFYIDALAGTGVSTYDDGQGFLGSPLLACREAEVPFTKMFFIESCEEKAAALRKRLDYAFSQPEFTKPDHWDVYEADANKIIDDIKREIYSLKGDGLWNYYCFIDNERTDVNWPFIETITPNPKGDLLINIPIATAIGRNYGSQAVDEFFGSDTSVFKSREQGLAMYESQIKRRDREKTVSTTIDGAVGSFNYELLYATRRTKGGSKYIKRVEAVRDFLESTDAEKVRRRLTVTEGDQEEISEWMPDSDVEFPDDDDDDDNQAGLGDFL